MIIPFNERFRRNHVKNNYSLNRSTINTQPLSRIINPHESIIQSGNKKQQEQQQQQQQQQQQKQYAQEIRREIMRARFTMHNLYGVATGGCRSCGS